MEGPLLHLQSQIETVRKNCHSGQSFFVFSDLQRILSASLVEDILNHSVSEVPKHHLSTATNLVLRDYTRIFCILVRINQVDKIADFLSRKIVDDKLPIETQDELCRIAPELNLEAFMKEQWHFIPWIFEKDALHIVFSDEIILPFIEVETIGEGAGGFISKVTIPQSLQRLHSPTEGDSVSIVRKVFKQAVKNNNDSHVHKAIHERECLEIYHTLQHPNILPLLASYTLNGQDALLVPFYSMDIESFLRQKTRFGEFTDTSTLTAALCGLASALQVVHEFNQRSKLTPTFLMRYGYHHDLRPANILVTSSTFILADFGLARPTLPDKDVSTIFTKNIGHYVAPECMNEKLEPRQIGRSYDIWGLGCLIIELTTYMELGPSGIEDFRIKRMTPYSPDIPFISGYFFNAGSVKEEVSEWLARLSSKPQERVTTTLVALARNLLQPDPIIRPKIGSCVMQTLYVHSKHLFYTGCSLLEQIIHTISQLQFPSSVHTTTELQLELSKLKAFGATLEMNNEENYHSELFGQATFAAFVKDGLETICDNLRRSRAHVTDNKKAWVQSKSHIRAIGNSVWLNIVDESFRNSLRELCEALPVPKQQYLSSLWRKYLLEGYSSEALGSLEKRIEELSTSYTDMQLHVRINRLDRALRQEIEMPEAVERNLIIDWSQIQPVRAFGRSHSLALYSNLTDGNKEPGQEFDMQHRVLIEWVFVSQMDEKESDYERVNKILVLAGLLSCTKPTGFRVLDCAGFLPPNKVDDPRYGFVYRFPTGMNDSQHREPVTLEQLLSDTKLPLTLGDKFNIAKMLASSLFELHCSGWVHKNIRSSNVIFFLPKQHGKNTKHGSGIETEPYLIGFHHSRPQSDVFCSDVNSTEQDSDAIFYQHPDYSSGDFRFQREYDYYGFGIVMLEIAFWRTCHDMWVNGKCKTTSRQVFVEKLVSKFVPRLAAVMGVAYMEATMSCLQGNFDYDEETGFSNDKDSQFYYKVLQKLDACFVG